MEPFTYGQFLPNEEDPMTVASSYVPGSANRTRGLTDGMMGGQTPLGLPQGSMTSDSMQTWMSGSPMSSLAPQVGVGSVGGSGQIRPQARPNGLGKNPTEPPAKSGFGWEKFGNIMDAVGSLGQVYAAIQANKINKQQLAFQKDAFNQNMANTKSSFNMALEDKLTSRQAMAGLNDGQVSDYLKKYTLT